MVIRDGIECLEFHGGPFDGAYTELPAESLSMVSARFYWTIPHTGRQALYRLVDGRWEFTGIAMLEDIIVPDWQI